MKDRVANRASFERYLTEREERQLFAHIGKHDSVLAKRDAAWMQLLRQTGIRVGSLSQLTVGMALDALAESRLVIADDIAKNESGYAVHLNTKAVAALRTLFRVRRQQGADEQHDAPLIVSQRQRGMSIRSFQARMQQWCRDAGLKVAASPHWMRHTLAKRVIARSEARDVLGIVQAALGHRSRESTAVYSLPDREAVARALEAAR